MRATSRLRRSSAILLALGIVLLLVIAGTAVFAEQLARHPATTASGASYLRPSAAHWLGTDDLGRDLFAQLVFGARVSVGVGMIAAISAMAVGTTVALVAGWWRGRVDALLMRLVDLTLSLPFLVLVLVMAAYFGRGTGTLTLLIALVLWARPARLLRSQVLRIAGFGHVRAAVAMGAPVRRILGVHVLARLAPLLSSQFVRAAAVAVVIQAGVAFLGLGDPSRVSWGSTLFFANNGAAILTDAWLWWVVPPGLALAVLIVGLAFISFALEELAEPRLASHGWRRPVRRALPDMPAAPAPDGVVLAVRGLSVTYGDIVAVEQVSVHITRGRVLGVVGESGSGKSTLALALMGLLPVGGTITDGEVVLGELDMRRLGRAGLARMRGRDIAMVPQAAMSLLDPIVSIIDQVSEVARHSNDRGAALLSARQMLNRVGVPEERHAAFPHEFSGGMRQRVVIAMALVNRPGLVICDEPTTGLDVVTQAEILDLLDELRGELGVEVMVVSHDLGVIGAYTDDIVVMVDGHIIERGPTHEVLASPSHPHTRQTLANTPSLDGPLRPWSTAGVDEVVVQ